MYSREVPAPCKNFRPLHCHLQGREGQVGADHGVQRGLFADDPEINALELKKKKWTNAFAGFGRYDFSEEVNVEVGHLFQRLVMEL